jgi:hypothetical protein
MKNFDYRTRITERDRIDQGLYEVLGVPSDGWRLKEIIPMDNQRVMLIVERETNPDIEEMDSNIRAFNDTLQRATLFLKKIK